MIFRQNGTWNFKTNSKEISGGSKKGLLSKLFDKAANKADEKENCIGNALDALNIDAFGSWEFSVEASTDELKELYEEVRKDNDPSKWEATCKNFSKAFDVVKRCIFDTAKEAVKEIGEIVESNDVANAERHKQFVDREIDKHNFEKDRNYPNCIFDDDADNVKKDANNKENKNDEK